MYKITKILFLSWGLFAFTLCYSQHQNNKEIQSIGGERDKHGCLPAAGQTWSKLKKKCIQVFNEGQRLNPVETKEGEAVFSAFILFNNDQTKAELFLPNNKQFILNPSNNGLYKFNRYTYNINNKTLYYKRKLIYKAK